MSAAKRVRWDCPTGEHAGVLASSRPRRNATARYCLPCSEATGVLVERIAPSLERKRTAKAAALESKREVDRQREREQREAAYRVPVIDRDGEPFVLDAMTLLIEAWKTDELRARQRDGWRSQRVPVPRLVIRRGKGRQHDPEWIRSPRSRSSEIRLRDALSGHAKGSGNEIVLTAGQPLGAEWLRAIVIHEAAHAACPMDTHHGSAWRSAYVRTVREVYPGVVLASVPEMEREPNWKVDEIIAEAIRDYTDGGPS